MTKQIVWNIPSDDKSLTFEGGFGFQQACGKKSKDKELILSIPEAN